MINLFVAEYIGEHFIVNHKLQSLWFPDVEDPADERRFKCQRCNRRYIRKAHLNRHIQFECGKKPQFRCHICGKRFTRKETLVVHVRTIHYYTGEIYDRL